MQAVLQSVQSSVKLLLIHPRPTSPVPMAQLNLPCRRPLVLSTAKRRLSMSINRKALLLLLPFQASHRPLSLCHVSSSEKKHRKRRRKALRDGMLKRLSHARHVLGECDNGIAAHILRLASWLHPIENPPQLLGNLHLTQSFWASLATVAELLAPWRKAPTADVLATATDLTWIKKTNYERHLEIRDI